MTTLGHQTNTFVVVCFAHVQNEFAVNVFITKTIIKNEKRLK